MSGPKNKLVSDEDLARFNEYFQEHITWGSLHIVLDDGNVEDSHVEFCRKYAIENGDEEGAYLAGVLAGLSQSQRLNLEKRVDKYNLRAPPPKIANLCKLCLTVFTLNAEQCPHCGGKDYEEF